MCCPRVSWALRCISEAHHPTWAAPPLKWRLKWPEQTRNSDLFIPLRQLAPKTFCNHANQNMLHYSTTLQKQINVGCLTVLWHLFSWVHKVTGSYLWLSPALQADPPGPLQSTAVSALISSPPYDGGTRPSPWWTKGGNKQFSAVSNKVIKWQFCFALSLIWQSHFFLPSEIWVLSKGMVSTAKNWKLYTVKSITS